MSQMNAKELVNVIAIAKDSIVNCTVPLVEEIERLGTLKPYHEWRDDFGDVLWYKSNPPCEAPIVGSPLNSDWPFEDLFWSPLPHIIIMAEESTQ